MPRTKAATEDDAAFLRSLEHGYRQMSSYMDNFDFSTANGFDLRKFDLARVALEQRTASAAGPTDKMSQFLTLFEEESLDGDWDASPAPMGVVSEDLDTDDGDGLVDLDPIEPDPQILEGYGLPIAEIDPDLMSEDDPWLEPHDDTRPVINTRNETALKASGTPRKRKKRRGPAPKRKTAPKVALAPSGRPKLVFKRPKA